MEHKPYPQDATKPPQSKFPWPLAAVIIGVGLLALIISFIPNTNRAAVDEMNKPENRGNLLRLTDISVAPQDIAGTANVSIYGQVTNAGLRPVNGAKVSAVFKDKNGAAVYEEQEPMEWVEVKGKGEDVESKTLDEHPIAPGKAAGFRVRYSQVPATWNHEPPELTVQEIRLVK